MMIFVKPRKLLWDELFDSCIYLVLALTISHHFISNYIINQFLYINFCPLHSFSIHLCLKKLSFFKEIYLYLPSSIKYYLSNNNKIKIMKHSFRLKSEESFNSINRSPTNRSLSKQTYAFSKSPRFHNFRP